MSTCNGQTGLNHIRFGNYFLIVERRGTGLRWSDDERPKDRPVERPSRVGDSARVGDRRLDIVGECSSMRSSSFLVSCSRRIGSRSGLRATLLNDASNTSLISASSSPARALWAMYSWRFRISCSSWSLSVKTCHVGNVKANR
jgi:hypothetical protein